jgi:hypothetical protein
MEAFMKAAGMGILLVMAGAALLGAQTAAQPAAAAQSVVYIRETSGTVEVKAPGSSEWRPAVPGEALAAASLISTGFKSTALVAVGSSLVTVRPLTRLSLEEIARNQNGERAVLNLRAGRVRAEVRPSGGETVDFSIRSPIATASVRGTAFEFDGTGVEVDEGRVYLGGEQLTGAYAGVGHSTAVNTETGTAVTALDSVKEELAPPQPAGVDTASSAPAAAAASTSGLDVGFGWD